MKFLCLFAILLFFAAFAYAGNIFGLNGQQTFDYSKQNNMSLEDWPADYRDLCEKHMDAVIERCKNSGYENWMVTRNASGQNFAQKRFFGAQDAIIGSEKCSYYENSIDKVFVFSVILTFACSENREGQNLRSDEYACNFSCSAWDCDPNVLPNEIAGCSVNPKEAEPGFFGKLVGSKPDPFGLQSADCQQDMEHLCAYNGPNCTLAKPCYFKEIGGKPSNVVFCKCSCPNKLLGENFNEQQWQAKKREPFDLDNFNFEEWQSARKEPCSGKRTVSERPKTGVDVEALRIKVNDLAKAIPPEAATVIGDGSINIKIGDIAGRSQDWQGLLQGSQIGGLAIGESEKPIIKIGASQKIIDQIQNSVDPENALKLALKNGFIKITLSDALKQAALDGFKNSLQTKQTSEMKNSAVSFNGKTGTIQTDSKNRIIAAIPGEKYLPVLNSFGTASGYTTMGISNTLAKSKQPFSQTAGIIPINPTSKNPIIIPTAPVIQTTKPPQIIIGSSYSVPQAAKAGLNSAVQYKTVATNYKAAYSPIVSNSSYGKSSAQAGARGGTIAYRIK